ncbi:hypothetical protein Q31b_11850 [Novipirellula aureliae]|uniref:General secretion pathway protein K n=1 Tax=Novipirellula aureliae TaxID=2527966 RepID=A0A5C6EDE6_9BACT|nr:hypothetical protein [Novipirellula aureliae]TWU46007.1 hypothetical protein Q31b_11850 [Novipirellula aureliae]
MKRRRLQMKRRGMALLVVMVIVMLVSLAAYGFNQQMTDAYRISQRQIERTQARLTAMSAIDALRVSIQQPRGGRIGWHHNSPESFAGIEIEEGEWADTDDSTSVWSFSVISPFSVSGASSTQTDPTSIEQAKTWRFGLSNESAKLNLAVLNEWEKAVPGQARKSLMNLPEMEASMADAIMRAYRIKDTGKASDRRLSDRIGAFATEGAAGSGNSLRSSDNSANGLARSWAWHWTGGDWDHNYQLDSLELALQSASLSANGFDAYDDLPRYSSGSRQALSPIAPVAWRDFVTFDSGQRNETLTGSPRVFLNGNDLQKLHQDLMAVWTADQANFVIAYRQYGGTTSGSAGSNITTISAAEWPPDFSVPAGVWISSSLELVGATVAIPQPENKVLRIRSPFSDDFGDRSDYLRALVDDVTVRPERVIDGQVDVNEAPREVLLGVPWMTPEAVAQIIERRSSATGTDASRDTIAWLLIENVVDLPTFKQLQPWITVGGDCYHAQIVSFRDRQTPMFRCTATLDARTSDVTIRNFRSWDAWGSGFSIDDLSAERTP